MLLRISVDQVIVIVVAAVAGVFPASAALAGVPVLAEPGTMHIPPAAPFNGMGSNSRRDVVGVYGFSGEFHASTVDLTIPGRKLNFVWARKYRSRIGPDTAMGNGWDFSYNISVEASGEHIILRDGNSRVDVYLKQPDDTWQRDEFFRVLEKNQDDTYTLEFADTGKWNFNALDGSVAEGKIASIVDRNGNTVSFDYDNSGRLATVHDTLDTEAHNRDIVIAYNGDGFIETVTDFIGRTVTYEYYQGGDDDGLAGDLKSVTSPAVTGTSTGNDFPDGKTTIYTYSKGFGNENLNHNLLIITDPKGQTYLTNTYAPTENPGDLAFDRVLTCVRGDPGDRSDYVYVPVVSDPGNNFAVIKAIDNDQVGNVEESLFDALNRRVIRSEFTGRAPNADAPTTPNQNRPIDPLRGGDPPVFVTRMEYNADALAIRIVHPNLNVTEYVYELEVDPQAPRRSRGNLRERHRLPGLLGGDQSTIDTFATFDPEFNFPTTKTDGRGNVTTYTYDGSGNVTHADHRIPGIVEDWQWNQFGQMTVHDLPDNGSAHRRRDEYTYYDSGPSLGYLERGVVDSPNLALTTRYEYDDVGNVTRTFDPRDHDTQYEVNQLNQVVRRTSREVADGGGVRYERDTYYDANDNVVRTDIQNINDAGDLDANEHFTTVYEYEILNRPIRRCQESGEYIGAIPGPPELPTCDGLPDSEFITTEYEYDEKRNRTLVRFGEAVNGNQPNNVVQSIYDERDLLFRSVRAPGDVDQSTTQYDYDGNSNLKRKLTGIETAPRITETAYDGYDRMVSSVDPMGNATEYHYDPNGNVGGDRIPDEPNPFGVRVFGELIDVEGSADNDRLSQTTFQYDRMDRRTREVIEFFDTESQAGIGDGQSVTDTEWSDNSEVVEVLDDNSHASSTVYDTANRVLLVTDAKGNTVAYDYDANSNVTTKIEVEKSDLGNPDEVFITARTYDNLDRLVSTTDNIGNTNDYGFDSRDNRSVLTDALFHETRYVYDGINRLIKTVRDLDDDGADTAADPGDGNPDIVTTQSWDDASRLIGQTDDNANTTVYAYDPLDRMTSELYGDQTEHIYEFDVHDNRIQMTDANGSVADCDYDLLDRLTTKVVAPGPGVFGGTTFEIYEHDGLSRNVWFQDDDSVVEQSYDSLSHVTSETLDGQTTTSVYDGVGNRLSCTYPGGRQVTNIYDDLDRQKVVFDQSGTIGTYDYIGPDRVEQRTYDANNTRTDYTYDGVKRIIGTAHRFDPDGINTVVDAREFAWDPMYNKTQRKDVRDGGPALTHDYWYDDIYRLVQTTVTEGGGGVVRETGYRLDGVGNREQVTSQSGLGDYFMDQADPPADFQVNQYTVTPSGDCTYDDNGNLLARIDSSDVDLHDYAAFVACVTGPDPQEELEWNCSRFDADDDEDVDFGDFAEFQRAFSGPADDPPTATIVYDYRNQIVEYTHALTGQRHTYAYDALGRRIAKVIDADGVADETRYFYLPGGPSRVCEEQDGVGVVTATYVYGLSIDEVLTMQRDVDGNGTPEDYYYHTDDLFNVVAVTNAAGSVVERSEYGDYGAPEGDSTIGNPYLFTGRRYDGETGLYYYRTRHLDPLIGRFLQRDSRGMWSDLHNLGSGLVYVGNGPATFTDPYGHSVNSAEHGAWLKKRRKAQEHAEKMAELRKLKWKVTKLVGQGAYRNDDGTTAHRIEILREGDDYDDNDAWKAIKVGDLIRGGDTIVTDRKTEMHLRVQYSEGVFGSTRVVEQLTEIEFNLKVISVKFWAISDIRMNQGNIEVEIDTSRFRSDMRIATPNAGASTTG